MKVIARKVAHNTRLLVSNDEPSNQFLVALTRRCTGVRYSNNCIHVIWWAINSPFSHMIFGCDIYQMILWHVTLGWTWVVSGLPALPPDMCLVAPRTLGTKSWYSYRPAFKRLTSMLALSLICSTIIDLWHPQSVTYWVRSTSPFLYVYPHSLDVSPYASLSHLYTDLSSC
jgi:hypothetical protein